MVLHQVDELGRVRAQISDLKRYEESLVDLIKLRGAGAYEGTVWRAVVSKFEQIKVDWKTVAEALGPTRQMIAAHTEKKCIVKLTMNSK